jgi:hypothetical protein
MGITDKSMGEKAGALIAAEIDRLLRKANERV